MRKTRRTSLGWGSWGFLEPPRAHPRDLGRCAAWGTGPLQGQGKLGSKQEGPCFSWGGGHGGVGALDPPPVVVVRWRCLPLGCINTITPSPPETGRRTQITPLLSEPRKSSRRGAAVRGNDSVSRSGSGIFEELRLFLPLPRQGDFIGFWKFGLSCWKCVRRVGFLRNKTTSFRYDFSLRWGLENFNT